MEAWDKTIRAAAYGGRLRRTRHPLGGMPRAKQVMRQIYTAQA